jgi:hypothetical protein
VPSLLTNNNPSNNQHINFKGDHCASPLRQVSHNSHNGEPVDVAINQTAPLTEDQNQDVNKHIKFKGDCCASPLRQVPNSKYSNEVDKTAIEQTEHGNDPVVERNPQEPETPTTRHPLMQDRNKRHTQEEHTRCLVANGLEGKKSQRDQRLARNKRSGRPPQKEVQADTSHPTTKISLIDNISDNPDPESNHNNNIWSINTEEQNSDTGIEQKSYLAMWTKPCSPGSQILSKLSM